METTTRQMENDENEDFGVFLHTLVNRTEFPPSISSSLGCDSLHTNFDFLFALLDVAGNFLRPNCVEMLFVGWLVGGPRAGVFVFFLSQFDR